MGGVVSMMSISQYAETVMKIIMMNSDPKSNKQELEVLEKFEKTCWERMIRPDPSFFIDLEKKYSEYENLSLERFLQKTKDFFEREKARTLEDNEIKDMNQEKWTERIKVLKESVCVARKILCLYRENLEAREQIMSFLFSSTPNQYPAL
jgi:hypothetical protein